MLTNKLGRYYEMDLLCRACLTGNNNMNRMTNDDLRFYEKLVNIKVDKNGCPKAMCYICYALLRKCQRFSDMANYSENILNNLFINNFEVTHETIAKLNIKPTQHLSVNHNKVIITLKSSKKYQKTVTQKFVFNQKHPDEGLLNCKIKLENSYDKKNLKCKTSNDFKQESLQCDFSADGGQSFACNDLNQDKSGLDNQEGLIKELQQKKASTRVKSFSCDKCEKRFSQTASLQNHKRIRHGINPYTCDCCSNTFRYKQVLQKHYITDHKQRLKVKKQPRKVKPKPMRNSYQCNHCNKNFSKDGYLKNHKRISHGVDKYKCQQCKVTFNSKSSLQKHNISIHRETLILMCDKCPKSFKLMGTLRLHMRTHTGEKPYACKFCDKRFSQNIVLIDHTNRIHSKLKPYPCKICDKRFPAQSDLRTHNRIVHLGDKPFVCDVCGNRFSMRCNLRSHLKIHTGEQPFSCAQCDKKFTQNYGLRRHMERVH